ncbi:MAG: NAD(P)H-quinone oxidoreductase [Geminicoccaceae bacterium]|nr:NAD(P)H-quinone oxidoreductase [Geminicoccaceae bacterium]
MKLPSEMNHIEIREAGGPEVLVPVRGPVPEAGEGEVLVKVAVAGVNRPDVIQRSGGYPPPPGASPIPGLEVSGEIVALGRGSGRFKVGDRVCALLSGGGYAQYCTVPEPQLLPVPAGLSMIEAAALPETFMTVWTNVFQRGGLKEGETFLVHGGSSGIGTTAIQLAKQFGARVLTTVGNGEKAAFCRELGADVAINYHEEDFVGIARGENGGKGVDVILDMVGGDYVERNIKSLASDGRLVQIAWLRSPKVTANFVNLMVKRLTWTGSTLRPRSIAEKGGIARELEARVWPLIEAGKVRPVISRTFPLADAASAHALMESSTHIGKIMLEVA